MQTEDDTDSKANVRMPSSTTLTNASKIAISQDRPIMFDYWMDSSNKACFIGVKESSEKLLVKNEDEYTSPISKIYKSGEEFIVLTENSIYLVDASIQTRRIS